MAENSVPVDLLAGKLVDHPELAEDMLAHMEKPAAYFW